jgi:hypothetical protein
VEVIKKNLKIKGLYLRALAAICTDEKIGGFGIRSMQAITEGLILSAVSSFGKDQPRFLCSLKKSTSMTCPFVPCISGIFVLCN